MRRSTIPRARDQVAASVASKVILKGPESGMPRKKNPAAVALGKLGGLKGGKARAAALSPARRSAIARKAARARWRLDTVGD